MTKEQKIEKAVLLNMAQVGFRENKLDTDTVAEYAALMNQGVTFPPLHIAEVGKQETRVLVGGAHRLAAGVKAKVESFSVIVTKVKTMVEAEVLAFHDNAAHGLQLTPAEKRQAIIQLIQKPAMKKLSNGAIAKKLGVSDMTIKRYRDSLGEASPKAKMSGHKSKPKAKADKPKTETGAGWRIEGSQLGGGAGAIANAIVSKITEGYDPKKSPKTHAKNVQVLRDAVELLQAFIDAAGVPVEEDEE
jgi:hypothetical protein